MPSFSPLVHTQEIEAMAMIISGKEANILLSALDEYLDTDNEGRIHRSIPGYTQLALQALRDHLFAAHEHPEEDHT